LACTPKKLCLRSKRRRGRLLSQFSQVEIVVLLPRGNGKTHLVAAIALHHLLTVENAAVYCAAASREQARILFEAAAGFARLLDHPNVVDRHLELRWCQIPKSQGCSRAIYGRWPPKQGCCTA